MVTSGTLPLMKWRERSERRSEAVADLESEMDPLEFADRIALGTAKPFQVAVKEMLDQAGF